MRAIHAPERTRPEFLKPSSGLAGGLSAVNDHMLAIAAGHVRDVQLVLVKVEFAD